MDEEELDVIHEAVRSSPDVDLPRDRRDLTLLGTFLERNPAFDTSAPDETYDKLWALQDSDRDVYVPQDDAEMERLVALLKRHGDLQLLQKLVTADDTVALLAALGHGDGGAGGGRAAGADTAGGGRAVSADTADGTDAGADEDDDGGWLSGDDEDDFLDHEDLDRYGELLGYAAGGIVCVTALATAYLTGFTVYKEVDSWTLTVDFHDAGAILIASALVALLASLVVGFVYRVTADDAYAGHRSDLAAAAFEVPLFGFILVGLLYLASPIVLNLVSLNLVDAVLYLVGLVVVLFIGGVPLLVGVFLAVGLVVGVPVYAGVYGGSLAGTPLAALVGE